MFMSVKNDSAPNTVLRTDRTVITLNPSSYYHLDAVEAALSRGVIALKDSKRPDFYEIEVGSNWYYICIPKPSLFVFLIATRKRSREHVSSRDRSAELLSLAV